MKKVKVSILLVFRKSANELFGCLDSIKKFTTTASFEIIVWDNSILKNIKSDLKQKYPEVFYVRSRKNIGYGAGNNAAAKHARGDYLFILNPDTQVQEGALDKLASFLDRNENTGIVSPNLIDEKGNLFDSIGTDALTPIAAIFSLSFINKLFPKNPVSRKYWLKDISKERVREVDTVPGAAFLIRKPVFAKIGGFDEKFFMYFEENDLCKRVIELGMQIFIIPEARVTHFWQPGEGGAKSKKLFTESRYYYFKKHYGIFQALVVEAFTRFSKRHAALVIILIIVIFLLAS